jgi:hypothetical protein
MQSLFSNKKPALHIKQFLCQRLADIAIPLFARYTANPDRSRCRFLFNRVAFCSTGSLMLPALKNSDAGTQEQWRETGLRRAYVGGRTLTNHLQEYALEIC